MVGNNWFWFLHCCRDDLELSLVHFNFPFFFALIDSFYSFFFLVMKFLDFPWYFICMISKTFNMKSSGIGNGMSEVYSRWYIALGRENFPVVRHSVIVSFDQNNCQSDVFFFCLRSWPGSLCTGLGSAS